MHLSHIPKEKYSAFIKHHFTKSKKKIDNDVIEYILKETRVHTYYVQYLCNRAFSSAYKNIDIKSIKTIYADILIENEAFYSSYRDILSPQQWKLLLALAKEGGFSSITSGEFIHNHKLSNASTVRRSLKSLMTKQMIFKEDKTYNVYDVFFARWLTRL